MIYDLKRKVLLLIFIVMFSSGCCPLITVFTHGDCMSREEFNNTYIDPEKRLQRDKLEPFSKNVPYRPENSKPDLNWKPWERQKLEPERLIPAAPEPVQIKD